MKKTDFNQAWQFRKIGPEPVAERLKEFQTVILPHDAMIHDDRSQQSPGGGACAYFVPGAYEYVKTFSAPKSWENKHVELVFGGVYQKALVYLNEQLLCEHAYGYTKFSVDLTDFLKIGEENTLRVVADNTGMPNTRWYSGAGIYRPVYLVTGNKSHILHQGVKVNTLTYKPAKVQVCTEFTLEETEQFDGALKTEILKDGILIASEETKLSGPAQTAAEQELKLPNAALWSAETPELYEAKVSLLQGGAVLDEATVSFGVRKVEWDRSGMKVNGQEVLLKGACVHHDNGILGACTYPETEARKIRILKENGFNAIRCAHNPAADTLLDAADKLGMYIMEESFDMWYMHKNKYDYASDFNASWQDDVASMVDNAYNHPSVIMYSIGNELSEPAKKQGVEKSKEIVKFIKCKDFTRPVTSGANIGILTASKFGIDTYSEDGPMFGEGTSAQDKTFAMGADNKLTGSLLFNTLYQKIGVAMDVSASLPPADKAVTPFFNTLDIAGYNYGTSRYKTDLNKYPDRLIVGSETMPHNIYTSWEMVKAYPNLIGDFMWTGWDYLGEAGVGTWNYEGTNVMNAGYPWILAGSGAIDINGYAGAEAKYASMVWDNENKPYIGVRPVNKLGLRITKSAWRNTNAFDSWSWRGCRNYPATVEVYAKAHHVKLLLNGETVGIKKVKNLKAVFHICYEPGILTAVAYNMAGQELASHHLTSATGPISLHLEAETDPSAVEPGSIVYVPITLRGENNVVESNWDCKVTVTVENGTLLGLGNANPKNPEAYDGNTCTTYYGRALAVVRAGESGTTTVRLSTGNYANEPDAVLDLSIL